ncbi:MAG: hypothetical protein NTX84_04455 [Nitrospirae bacterium]|nr:hypothetical protein [Nitrospirota bacterium]
MMAPNARRRSAAAAASAAAGIALKGLEYNFRELIPTRLYATLQLSIGNLGDIENAAILNHGGQRSNGIGAAAEPEQIEAVSRLVDVNEFGIQIANVLRKSHPERTTDDLQGKKGRTSYPIVIESDLRPTTRIILVPLNIDGFIELEDVGATRLDVPVTGAVRAKHDILIRHSLPLLGILRTSFIVHIERDTWSFHARSLLPSGMGSD